MESGNFALLLLLLLLEIYSIKFIYTIIHIVRIDALRSLAISNFSKTFKYSASLELGGILKQSYES